MPLERKGSWRAKMSKSPARRQSPNRGGQHALDQYQTTSREDEDAPLRFQIDDSSSTARPAGKHLSGIGLISGCAGPSALLT